uniref:W2 domain-containing protein n=1 Tax=Octopus bimaculoides TaxID=37653 RepID=A0A0L8FYX2_OCTBM
MSQKAPKPILSGQRLKTRKRDEKEKYDPSSFRDAIILGLNECSNDLEQVSKYLDTAGSRLDYRRYAEVLFDILFTGGQLGLSLEFSTIMFRTWLNEKDINSVSAAMKRSQIENRLLELFPINKRSQEAFLNHFQEAGLGPVANLQRVQQSAEVKKELQKDLTRMINDNEPIKEIIAHLKEYMTKHKLSDHEMVVLVWNTVMGTVEWNKKEELVAEQALKHLRNYSLLFTAVAKTEKSELNLMVRIQEYCYDNINFMKVFQKIIILFYKSEVLSEDVVLKWYRDSPSSKGKGIFVSQMKKFVEWLKSAEEESD